METLGPTKRLRFIGGDNIAVSAQANLQENRTDITISESATPVSTLVLDPTQRLYFLGITPVTVSATSNSSLQCIDVTIDGEAEPVSAPTSINFTLDFTGSSYMQAGFTLWSYFTNTPEYPVGGPPFVAVIDWGDGSVMEHYLTNELGELYFSHTYSTQSIFTVTLWCTDWSIISDFYVYESWEGIDTHNVIAPIPWSSLIIMKDNLRDFLLMDCPIGGTVPVALFEPFTKLQELWFSGNGFTGTIPNMAACTHLTKCFFSDNFTDVIAGSFATQASLGGIHLDGCAFTQTAVDQILLDCINSLSLPNRNDAHAYLGLNGGTSSPPSNPTGLARVQTLRDNGWIVWTN